MPRPDPLRDIELLVRSRHGLIVIDSSEEERVTTLLRHVSDRIGLTLFIWSRTRGLRRDGADNAVYGTADAAQLLAHIGASGVPALYLLTGFAPLLAEDAQAEPLRDAAAAATRAGGAIIIVAETPASFLAWLQDRRGDVFTVATANDVSRLPQELLRKGRFDEVFFVDLPSALERRAITAIHLQRRGRTVEGFDTAAIAAAAEGFSGAEIEPAIVSALYTAFAAQGALTTDGILAEVRATRPLAVTMAERIAGLRAWAAGRTVPA